MRVNIPLIPIALHLERREMISLRRVFRLRSLMIAVALIALGLAIWLGRRRDDYRMWAGFHADQERKFIRQGDNASAAVHEVEKRRYLEGTSHPWLEIPPDPGYEDIHPGGANYQKSRREIERFR